MNPATTPDPTAPAPARAPASHHTAGCVARDALARAALILGAAGVPCPQVDARWLVAHAAGVDPLQRPDATLDDAASGALASLVARRAAREPLQLVLGEAAFRHLTLACRAGVFVPRPETEVVAGLAIAAAIAAGPRALVGEPCTGTGAIACSLAAEVAGVRVVAGDLDARAVAAARGNVRRLVEGAAGVDGPAPGATVEVRHGHLLAALPADLRGRLDVLVANPPYLPAADREGWAPEVALHDPERALIGGPDGHEVVAALVADAHDWLRPHGMLVLEIDARRAASARTHAHRAGLSDVRVEQDLTGAPRALLARRPATRAEEAR
jgi:release factor glutamine methyltransferase